MNTPQANPNCVLSIDDSEPMLAVIGKMAHSVGFQAAGTTTTAQFMREYSALHPNVVVLDLFLKNEDSLSVIDFLGRNRYTGAVILISGFDHRFLKAAADLARDHGLHVLGVVEKGSNIDKLPFLLRATYIGAPATAPK
jgi:ActR/RegA family two-component response regulator